MKKDKKVSKNNKFLRNLSLVLSIFCSAFLIVEAATPGENSAKQSNVIGGLLAKAIDTISGDQTKEIVPINLSIKNKIDKAYVGDKYSIQCVTNPSDATAQSTIYYSSNEQVAKVDNNGLVTFYESGNVSISIKNLKYPSLCDSMDIEVLNVELNDFDCYIEGATCNKDVYILNVNKNYRVNTTFDPINTTFKDVSYTLDNNHYASIDSQGIIYANSYSYNNINKLTISTNNLAKDIYFMISYENADEITRLEWMPEKKFLYPGEVMSATISTSPNDALLDDYYFTTSDESIISIVNNKFVAKNTGTATITAKSKANSQLFVSYNFDVLDKCETSNISCYDMHLFVNQSMSPYMKADDYYKYIDNNKVEYIVNDTSIVKVIDNKLVGLKKGSTEINVKYNGLDSGTFNVSVDDASIYSNNHVLGFEINHQFNNQSVTMGSYDLPSKFNFKVFDDEWIYDDDSNIDNIDNIKDVYYVFANNMTSFDGNIIDGNTITFNSANNIYTIYMVYKGNNSIYEIPLTINVTNPINPLFLGNNLDNNSTINLNTKNNYLIKLNEANTYDIKLYDSNNNNYTFVDPIINVNHDEILINSLLNTGSYRLVITPIVDNVFIDSNSFTINIDISNKLIEKLDYKIFDNNDNLLENPSMKINDTITISPIVDLSTTNNLYLYSNNPDIIIDNFTVKALKNGIYDIYLKDNLTDIETKITLDVYNNIEIDDSNSIIFSGKDSSFNKKDNLYELTNGYSGSVKLNFTDNTTFKTVLYSSSDTGILSIGKDGKITPNKKGIATITMTVDDNQLEPIVYKIKVKVNPQSVIKDFANFLSKTRKAIGHFGAFMFLGIFSTITFALYFIKQKLYLGLGMNLAYGFSLASLTEIIQLFTLDRYGCFKDVMIDYSGFLISSLIASLIIILIYKKKKDAC